MTETTLVHSDYRHTCTHSCSKVMSKALAPTRCRCMTLAHQPRCLACAEDACNARLKSIPVPPRGAAGRAACSMHVAPRHHLDSILRPPRPLSSPHAISEDAESCSAARRMQSDCTVRRSTVAAHRDVDNSARGARPERRRRHQTGAARAFSTTGACPYFVFFCWDGTQGERCRLPSERCLVRGLAFSESL